MLRLVYEADGIPKEFPMQSAATSADDDFVDVAGKAVSAADKVHQRDGSEGRPAARNAAEFGDYRKYSADSTIRYGGSDQQ